MAEEIQIGYFLQLADSFPVIDVRSPGEFHQGHIPHAVNIPLFDNRERKEVGTTYRQKNREAALFTGLEIAGKKQVKLAKKGLHTAGPERTLLVHCWRGGMRSRSMVWLFETMGIKCYVLQGGYKSYRRQLRDDLAIPFEFCVIGGKTGSGKTGILHYLGKEGQQVIDLEALANHKGSAFGALGEMPQPTTEQFENNLHAQLMQLDRSRKIWIEDESRNIGRCVIPPEIYARMLKSRIIFLDIPREVRANHLVRYYASSDREELKACVRKIEKKLGGERTVAAIESIDNGQFHHTAMITLKYYDKAYMYSLGKNHKVYHILKSDTVDPVFNAGLIRKTLTFG